MGLFSLSAQVASSLQKPRVKSNLIYRDRRMIHYIYENERGIIRCGNTKEEAVIRRGFRQDCSLSPVLFHLYTQRAVDRVHEISDVARWVSPRVKIMVYWYRWI